MINDLKGDRIWLFTGQGTPRSYFLCARFLVDRVKKGRNFNYVVSGTEGIDYDPCRGVDREPWFTVKSPEYTTDRIEPDSPSAARQNYLPPGLALAARQRSSASMNARKPRSTCGPASRAAVR